jgi:AhpD family alkylhydroperoxidase
MAGIRQVNPAEARGRAKTLLDGVQERLGMTPNMMKIMAASPAVLGGYLSFRVALAKSALDARFRVQIALAVAQANNSEYCLACHTACARRMGLSEAEIEASRRSWSEDAKKDAGLKFARALVLFRGRVSDQAIGGMQAAGYSDAETVEIVANVAVEIFANYFNEVAGTEADFPQVSPALSPPPEQRCQ